MELLRASAHKVTTSDGSQVDYARLLYRAGSCLVGQSLLMARLPPHTQQLARGANGAAANAQKKTARRRFGD